MPVTDLQVWANNLEDVRLPTIESEIDDLQLLSQTLTDNLAANVIATGVAQDSADAAQADATSALQEIVSVDLGSKAYTDAAIQSLRDSILGTLDTRLVVAAQTTTDEIEAANLVLESSIQTDLANTLTTAQNISDQMDVVAQDTNTALSQMTTVDLPALQTQADSTQADHTELSTAYSLLTTGFSYPSLVQGFDVLDASVTQQSVAITDLQNNASAGYLVKAQAGTEVSLLELIAADGTAGSVSVAKIAASEIILDGSVTANSLLLTGEGAITPETIGADVAGAAAAAITIANEKSAIFYQDTAPTLVTHPNLQSGDTWIHSTTNVHRLWDGATQAWYINDLTKAINAGDTYIDGGMILTNSLSAESIDTTSFNAVTINGLNILAGNISGSLISGSRIESAGPNGLAYMEDGEISGAHIKGGTITGAVIQTGTYTAIAEDDGSGTAKYANTNNVAGGFDLLGSSTSAAAQSLSGNVGIHSFDYADTAEYFRYRRQDICSVPNSTPPTGFVELYYDGFTWQQWEGAGLNIAGNFLKISLDFLLDGVAVSSDFDHIYLVNNNSNAGLVYYNISVTVAGFVFSGTLTYYRETGADGYNNWVKIRVPAQTIKLNVTAPANYAYNGNKASWGISADITCDRGTAKNLHLVMSDEAENDY